MMYNNTGIVAYLNTARAMAQWFLNHLPASGVPYWCDLSLQLLRTFYRIADKQSCTGTSTLPSPRRSTPRPRPSRRPGSSSSPPSRRSSPTPPAPTTGTPLLRNCSPIPQCRELGAGPAHRSSGTAPSTTLRNREACFHRFSQTADLLYARRNNNTGTIYGDYFWVEAGNRLLAMGLATCSDGSPAARGRL